MNTINELLLPSDSASDFFKKYRRRMAFLKFLKESKHAVIVLLTLVFVVGFSSPTAQTSIVSGVQMQMDSLEGRRNRQDEETGRRIATLAEIVRFATDFRLNQREALMYAGLIFHASMIYEVDPMEIAALITAESSFVSDSINRKSGDYGLGQINWKYWGKPNGLTPQDLLDPAINVVMICEILNHYENDFSRYHRGDGIRSKAYLINVKSILASLKLHEKALLEKEQS